MTTQKRDHKKVKLQFNSNRYTITIPEFFVRKVLCAEKGSLIEIDFEGNKVILTKKEVNK